MGMGKRVWIVGLVGLLVVVDVVASRWLGHSGHGGTGDAKPAAVSQAKTHPAMPAPKPVAPKPLPPLFKPDELQAFLAAATKAEAIADPLKRCLAYPDPPRSHWDRTVVTAYCQYRNQPIVTRAQVRKLIQSGQVAELDRRLGAALQAQLTQPQARGRLDRTFFADFDDGSLDERYLLDAWKRQAPDSAFALAASGYAYVSMAIDARGNADFRHTSPEAIEAMGRLMKQADTDLERARQLEPRLTPVYTAMVRAGAFALGEGYLRKAVEAGLKQSPANFSIAVQYLWAEEPQWYGSVQAMRKRLHESLRHADANPLLRLIQPEVPAYLANVVDCCGQPVALVDFPVVFDNVAKDELLSQAGLTAANHGQYAMGAIYLSEALRFNPQDYPARFRLARLLTADGTPRLLLHHAQALLAANPRNPEALAFSGYARLQLDDLPHARRELLDGLAMDPSNISLLSMVGRIYVYTDHDWAKGWDIADRLVAQYPNSPEGWRLRASIQLHQPRDGLDDTMHYFILHFGTDPEEKSTVREMENMLQAEAHGGKDPLAPFRGPRSVPVRPVTHASAR